jgi:hypothetical protein
MHGSVCLFSKYLQHLFEGENLNELDISSAGSTDNIFSSKKTLSTGWTGTCPVLKLFNSIQTDYNSQIDFLNTVLSSTHSNTMSSYQETSNLIDNIFVTSTISAAHPSGSNTLTPNFEIEFSDKTNASLLGGEIYNDFNNKLKPYIEEQNTNIIAKVNNLVNNNGFKSSIDSAYTNFVNFDTAVATASNVMNNKMLDLKDYFLTLQFLLMFFTWGYLLFFVAAIVLYIIYVCKEYDVVYYIIIVIINIIFVIILVEIFLSSFFGQVRLICHEIPRAINFIFIGAYMVSGNSASYPAQFGRGDANMTKMFTSCLSGTGDLSSLFINSNDLSSLISVQEDVTNLYTKINNTIYDSNLILNDYNSIKNSAFLRGIIKLELMKNNLYLAYDDIYNIVSKIRSNLVSENCSMTYEYYVIKDSDCPSGSVKLNTIRETSGQYHCYIIQNLASGSWASYQGSSCENEYTNKAITFIKQIDTLLDSRLTKLKNLQESFSKTFRNLSSEVYSTSQALNSTYNLLNKDLLLASNITNCGSSRFDLIDFSDFIGDTTEYDARIVVIFSAFIGVFGFDLLYSFLVVLNGFVERDTTDDYDDYGYNYGNKNKIRNINIKVNKPKKNRESSDYDEEEEEEDNKKSFKKERGKTPPKSGQKVEMSYLTRNNDNSDSD